MKKVLTIVVVLPILAAAAWAAFEVYDLSIRYGTSDPCEMIAERITSEMFEAIDPLGLNPLMYRERPAWLGKQTARVRQHGAWGCWKSVLFDIPTETEVFHANFMEVSRIERSWERWKQDGDKGSRLLALWAIGRANADVIGNLLGQDQHEAIKAALAEAGRQTPPDLKPKIEAAVEQYCSWRGGTCFTRHLELLEIER